MLRRVLVRLLFQLLIVGLMLGTWVDQQRRPRLGFPRDPDALKTDPDWLVSRLIAAGALPEDADVSSVHVQRFKTNEAFRSIVAAVDVSFTTAHGPAVRHFVAKFAPEVTSLRDHAVYLLQANATKEAGVYRDLSTDPAVAAPRAWIVELHASSGNLCIVMDRCVDAFEITERDGCPADDCGRVIDAMATLHARYWRRTDEAGFLEVVPDWAIDHFSSLFEGPDAALFGTITRFAWRSDGRGPTTVLHGDARVGNVLFHNPPDDAVTFIDWQAARTGKGVFDVAYFLALSVDGEVRRAHETDLLRRYHDGLVAGGVADYSFEQLWHDYRMSQVLTFAFVTLPFMSAESSSSDLNTTGLADLAEVWTNRMIGVIQDLDLDWVGAQTGTDGAALHAAFLRLAARTRSEGAS